jgi:hypothetical protein
MNVELTSRSAAIIAREQSEHGAISPEQLIEQALEAYIVNEPLWFHADSEARHRLVLEGLEDARHGGLYSADDVLRDLNRIADND